MVRKHVGIQQFSRADHVWGEACIVVEAHMDFLCGEAWNRKLMSTDSV